jgi:hypothetical protein
MLFWAMTQCRLVCRYRRVRETHCAWLGFKNHTFSIFIPGEGDAIFLRDVADYTHVHHNAQEHRTRECFRNLSIRCTIDFTIQHIS